MELKETVEEIRKKRKELQAQLNELFMKFTNETGLTIRAVDPEGLYEMGKEDTPVGYRSRVELIWE